MIIYILSNLTQIVVRNSIGCFVVVDIDIDSDSVGLIVVDFVVDFDYFSKIQYYVVYHTKLFLLY
jgi:hypothetical protein